MPETEQTHFFASSYMNWTCGETLQECIERQRKVDCAKDSSIHAENYSVWEVPGPVETPYKIWNYAPQVEGAKLIGTFDHKK